LRPQQSERIRVIPTHGTQGDPRATDVESDGPGRHARRDCEPRLDDTDPILRGAIREVLEAVERDGSAGFRVRSVGGARGGG